MKAGFVLPGIVLAALAAIVVTQAPEPPVYNSEPFRTDWPEETVPPPTSSPPPPQHQGPWVVYATGENYIDDAGREYDPPAAVISCVPKAELDAGTPEDDLTFWDVIVKPGQYQQDDYCPTDEPSATTDHEENL